MSEKTLIVVVLDRSGSMSSVREATNTGFNEFLKAQRAEPGEAFMTLVQFDDRNERVFTNKPLSEVEGLNLQPRGNTALLDAIGHTIVENKEAAKVFDRVLFVVITDGFENASRYYNRNSIKEMMASVRADLRWEFVFIGANQDAITTGESIGFAPTQTMSYASTSKGAAASFNAVSRIASNYRASGVATVDSYSKALNYNEIANSTGQRKVWVQPWKSVQPATSTTKSTRLGEAGVTIHLDKAEAHSFQSQHWGRIQKDKAARAAQGVVETDADKKPYLSPEGDLKEMTVDDATYQKLLDAAKAGEHGVRLDKI